MRPKGHYALAAVFAAVLAGGGPPSGARGEDSATASSAVDIHIPPPDLPPVVVTIDIADRSQADIETGSLPASEIASATAKAEISVWLPPPELPQEVVITLDGGRSRTEISGLAPAGDGLDRIIVPLPPAPPEPLILAPQLETTAAGPVPADAIKAALQRLKTGDRIPEAEAVAGIAFYEARDFAPLWIENGQWNSLARDLRARLAAAGDDGLDLSRYRTVSAFHAAGEPHFPALAAAEAQLTEAVILYAREAAIGRVRPGQVHELITPRLSPPSAAAVLSAVLAAKDPGATLGSFNPPHPEFAALRRALADARLNRPVAAPGEPIPEGPPLRLGMRDPRVPLIRARLGLGADGAPIYNREVSVKVASLQRESGLPVNGLFTPATRRVLVGEAPSPEEAEIVANMEFWRWVPRDLGAEHIMVNAPALEVVVRREGEIVHRARTIIGKTATQTPFFSDVMDHIVVNPSWYIPPGILKREPKYLDAAYAAAHGYEITTRGSQVSVRMPPGASNALGNVKFMFPNSHAVYLHDTPNRRLFGATQRTLSNGCVRVENPLQLAALLFASEGWTEARFRRLVGGGERRMNLPRKIPIHLVYFTLGVDSDGRLVRHPDVYGHSLRIRRVMGLS